MDQKVRTEDLWTSRNLTLAVRLLLALLLAGLLARILNYPLNHDEQLFLTAAAELPSWRLYDDLGFNHFPNLPYLLSAILGVTNTGYLLLTGRIVVFLCWLAALAALWLIGRRLGAGPLASVTALLLLLGNVMLLGQPGMLATNNLVTIPFALFALYFLLRGLDRVAPSPICVFLAGVFVSLAIGFKANYIFLVPPIALAALLAPSQRPLAQRLVKGVVPLALGGLIGGIPVLAYLASDYESLLAHTLRYFTELHAAYWANSDIPQISSVAKRVVLAEQIWLSNANLLALCAFATLLIMPQFRKEAPGDADQHQFWPLLVVLALIGLGVVVSFAPKPSFPQYFVPPVPFIIAALLVAAARLNPTERAYAAPLLLAVAILAVAGSASRLLPELPRLANPGELTAVKLHRKSSDLLLGAGLRPGDKVATLAPVYALEAGMAIYPELAAGPFVYRVARYIPQSDRKYYRTTSEFGLYAFLDADPPAAVLTGEEGPLDRNFETWAAARGYRLVSGPTSKEWEGFHLYVRPR